MDDNISTTPLNQGDYTTGTSSTISPSLASFNFNQKGLTLQGFRCPDCPSDTTSCMGCFRFERNYKTNVPISSTPYKLKPDSFVGPVQPACYNCPNHPINGGSGNCNCTLGTIPVIC